MGVLPKKARDDDYSKEGTLLYHIYLSGEGFIRTKLFSNSHLDFGLDFKFQPQGWLMHHRGVGYGLIIIRRFL